MGKDQFQLYDKSMSKITFLSASEKLNNCIMLFLVCMQFIIFLQLDYIRSWKGISFKNCI